MRIARRPIRSRVVAIYRIDPEALARRLPEGVLPRLHSGEAVAVLCYTRLGTIGSRFLPHRGASSNHLSYRFLVERSRKGRAVQETWVARRETSSRLGAGLGERILGQDHGRSTFEVAEDVLAFSLRVASARGEEFYLRAEPCGASSSRFLPTAREVQALLCSSGEVRPVDLLVPEADALDVRNGFAPEPLVVFEIRSAFLDDPQVFPAGSTNFDSAWRLVTQRLEPIREAKSARAPVLRRAPSQAFPAC